ncbi:MAG: hypothetical protein IT449_00410 [Phycisphaerales bacterium]|nr:hypothetical protein [Phycisphaerales bacterium]
MDPLNVAKIGRKAQNAEDFSSARQGVKTMFLTTCPARPPLHSGPLLRILAPPRCADSRHALAPYPALHLVAGGCFP